MTYVSPSGRRFTLAHHDLDGWARAFTAHLFTLGCSPAYCAAVAADIRAARPDYALVDDDADETP